VNAQVIQLNKVMSEYIFLITEQTATCARPSNFTSGDSPHAVQRDSAQGVHMQDVMPGLVSMGNFVGLHWFN
jgi:hypothetical protein